MYTIHLTTTGPSPQGGHQAEDVFNNFNSIPEIRSWAKTHCYVLGIPMQNSPTYAIEHQDGSNLTAEELTNLQPEDSCTTYHNMQLAKGVKKPSLLPPYAIIDAIRTVSKE